MDTSYLEHLDRKVPAIDETLDMATLRLTLERGPEERAELEEIAAEAGASPRMYNYYSASRSEEIGVLAQDKARRVGWALLSRPADEPLDEAISYAMLTEYAGKVEPDRVGLGMLMAYASPRVEFLKSLDAVERALAEAISQRAGTDLENDLRAGVVAAAVADATRLATETWLRRESGATFVSVLREALSLLAPVMRQVGQTGI